MPGKSARISKLCSDCGSMIHPSLSCRNTSGLHLRQLAQRPNRILKVYLHDIKMHVSAALARPGGNVTGWVEERSELRLTVGAIRCHSHFACTWRRRLTLFSRSTRADAIAESVRDATYGRNAHGETPPSLTLHATAACMHLLELMHDPPS